MIIPLAFLFLFQVTEVPFKAKSEFEVKIDLNFKQKENDFDTSNKVTLDYTETKDQKERRLSGNQLPYLALKIKFTLLSDQEEKVKIINNLGKTIYSKKADLKTVIKLDVGFIDDVKDEVTPNVYDVILLNSQKREVGRINITISKDGTFLVNNEKRGKF
jgi:hypothetical protein